MLVLFGDYQAFQNRNATRFVARSLYEIQELAKGQSPEKFWPMKIWPRQVNN